MYVRRCVACIILGMQSLLHDTTLHHCNMTIVLRLTPIDVMSKSGGTVGSCSPSSGHVPAPPESHWPFAPPASAVTSAATAAVAAPRQIKDVGPRIVPRYKQKTKIYTAVRTTAGSAECVQHATALWRFRSTGHTRRHQSDRKLPAGLRAP